VASVVNSSTLELRRSVNTPSFAAPWVVVSEAAADAIAAIVQRYRKWVVDHVEEMDAGEKAAVDAALVVARNVGLKAELSSPTGLAAFALLVLDELNAHAATTTAILDAIDNASNLGDVKTAISAIADVPQRTKTQMRTSWENKIDSLNGGGF